MLHSCVNHIVCFLLFKSVLVACMTLKWLCQRKLAHSSLFLAVTSGHGCFLHSRHFCVDGSRSSETETAFSVWHQGANCLCRPVTPTSLSSRALNSSSRAPDLAHTCTCCTKPIPHEREKKQDKKNNTVLSLEYMRQYLQKTSNSVQEKGAKTEEWLCCWAKARYV